MLEPRRLATRAAARRMAQTTRTDVGGLVGYQTRDERHIGAATRIEVVTEGVLTRRLQNDPELPGVGLVIFDEVHERNLTTDLGLALALDVASTIRPDLRLLAMSATPDVEGLTALLDAPVVESEGRMFEVDMHWMPRSPSGGGHGGGGGRSGPRRGGRRARPGPARWESNRTRRGRRGAAGAARAGRRRARVPPRNRRDPAHRDDAQRCGRLRGRRVPARRCVVACRAGRGARAVAARASPRRAVDRHRRDVTHRRRRPGGRRQRTRSRTAIRCSQRDDPADHRVDQSGVSRAASGTCRTHRAREPRTVSGARSSTAPAPSTAPPRSPRPISRGSPSNSRRGEGATTCGSSTRRLRALSPRPVNCSLISTPSTPRDRSLRSAARCWACRYIPVWLGWWPSTDQRCRASSPPWWRNVTSSGDVRTTCPPISRSGSGH